MENADPNEATQLAAELEDLRLLNIYQQSQPVRRESSEPTPRAVSNNSSNSEDFLHTRERTGDQEEPPPRYCRAVREPFILQRYKCALCGSEFTLQTNSKEPYSIVCHCGVNYEPQTQYATDQNYDVPDVGLDQLYAEGLSNSYVPYDQSERLHTNEIIDMDLSGDE